MPLNVGMFGCLCRPPLVYISHWPQLSPAYTHEIACVHVIITADNFHCVSVHCEAAKIAGLGFSMAPRQRLVRRWRCDTPPIHFCALLHLPALDCDSVSGQWTHLAKAQECCVLDVQVWCALHDTVEGACFVEM